MCLHEKSTYIHPDIQTSGQTDIQTDRQTDGNFFLLVLSSDIRHKHSSKGENSLSTHAMTILSLLKYSVCNEKVKTASLDCVNEENYHRITGTVFSKKLHFNETP